MCHLNKLIEMNSSPEYVMCMVYTSTKPVEIHPLPTETLKNNKTRGQSVNSSQGLSSQLHNPKSPNDEFMGFSVKARVFSIPYGSGVKTTNQSSSYC